MRTVSSETRTLTTRAKPAGTWQSLGTSSSDPPPLHRRHLRCRLLLHLRHRHLHPQHILACASAPPTTQTITAARSTWAWTQGAALSRLRPSRHGLATRLCTTHATRHSWVCNFATPPTTGGWATSSTQSAAPRICPSRASQGAPRAIAPTAAVLRTPSSLTGIVTAAPTRRCGA